MMPLKNLEDDDEEHDIWRWYIDGEPNNDDDSGCYDNEVEWLELWLMSRYLMYTHLPELYLGVFHQMARILLCTPQSLWNYRSPTIHTLRHWVL